MLERLTGRRAMVVDRPAPMRPSPLLAALALAALAVAGCAGERPSPVGTNCVHPNGPGTMPVCSNG